MKHRVPYNTIAYSRREHMNEAHKVLTDVEFKSLKCLSQTLTLVWLCL